MKQSNILIFLLLAFCTLTKAAEYKPVLIIPVEINSVEFSSSAEDMRSLLSKAEEYYSVLEGKYPNRFVIGPTITLDNGKYSSTTAHYASMEAYKLCSRLLNMNDYANDRFGIIFSGSDIWPHENKLKNGKHYFAISEIFEEKRLALGLFCHEYGHILGLKDLYDTDNEQSSGLSKGVWGSLSLMDKGERNNNAYTPSGLCAIELQQLGIGICDTLKPGKYVLEPLSSKPHYIYLPTDTSEEYFLMECRDEKGWDKYIGGSGMVIYHIDRSSNKAGYSTYYETILTAAQRWDYNQVNCRPDHPCATILEATPDADEISEVFFPSKQGQNLSSESVPALRFWNGRGPQLALKGITREADGSICFTAIEPIKQLSIQPLQDAALIEWLIDENLRDGIKECSITLSSKDTQPLVISAKINSEGRVSCYITKLQSNTTYTAELMINTGEENYSYSSIFKTMIVDERNTIPFIYLQGIKKNNGLFIKGSHIPLYVFNAIGAKDIRWSFDGSIITPDERGGFIIHNSGMLRAEITYDDGTTDVINKTIQTR